MNTVVLWPSRLAAVILRPSAPHVGWGIALAAALIVAEILIVLALKRISPENAFGAILLFGVLVISAGWGLRLAVATSVVSSVAYAYIHAIDSSGSLVPAVLVFSVLALLTNTLVGQSRLRAVESDQRRREAVLLASLARTMLRTSDWTSMLDDASTRLSRVLDLPPPYAALGPEDAPVGEDRARILLRDAGTVAGALFVPAGLGPSATRRIERVVPALEALLAAARDRQKLHEHTVYLGRQQASLRRVATLVALRVDPDDVFVAVAEELTQGLRAEHVSILRYDADGFCTVLATRDPAAPGNPVFVGLRMPLGGYNASTIVCATGEPASVDFTRATGTISARVAGRGLTESIGVPITVDGRIWGAVIVGSVGHVQSKDNRDRLADFADLIATAVYNIETRLQLTRSRTRVVAAADQARRTIERDLHDGAQQRIVSLGMELRAAQSAVPAELVDLRESLNRSVETLSQVHTDLRELSRGIHPAVLSRGGLGPALKTLSRRSPIPVSLSTDIPNRLPDPVEIAAYYVVAEALTNTAKYADATHIEISAVSTTDELVLTVCDDGCGGADPQAGSGLIGLEDRVAAVGGTMTISSPPGVGTTLTVRIARTTS